MKVKYKINEDAEYIIGEVITIITNVAKSDQFLICDDETKMFIRVDISNCIKADQNVKT